MKVNSNFCKLPETYLFSRVGNKVKQFQSSHPDKEVIRMDIGDVTLPLAPAVVKAMKEAVEDMTNPSTFRGYGPEQGYDFLRNTISINDYEKRGADISPEEIFISDGAKCDVANITDLFSPECVVGVPNPVYPVYVDSNIIAGRNIENGRLKYIDCDPETYKPLPDNVKCDVVYLCSPNNPTGTVLNREELKQWVDWAIENHSIIIFDSAYEAFIRDENLPRSIYEIEGARKVAVEIRSFSKTAGFTGIRCGYTVVPKDVKASIDGGGSIDLRKLWLRRQTTKFNGASYIVQRGAEAVYSPEGKKEVRANIEYYLRNSSLLLSEMTKKGLKACGGENSPYVWIKGPEGFTSWELFDLLLEKCLISTTPGSGFGSCGEGCVRMTGFNSYENTKKAVERIADLKW